MKSDASTLLYLAQGTTDPDSSAPDVGGEVIASTPASPSSLLEVMRDLQMPAEISWWPPAPGWWFLSGLVILAYVQWRHSLLTRWFRRSHPSQPLGASALARDEIAALRRRFDETMDVYELVSSLSVLLRRVSMEFFPREEVAALTGESWLRWLDSQIQSDVFSSGIGRVLIDAPYRKPEQVSATVNGEALLRTCEGWVMTVTRGEQND